MSSAQADDSAVNAVGYTSQITAAFRAVELAHSTAPIIQDPLSPYFGKAAWQTAFNDWQQLVQLQGPGKSLRVPARNRLIDDLLMTALQQLSTTHTAVQVVNIGCGMDSKPWRLHMPTSITWFDVDQPGVTQTKLQLLADAGAATASTSQPSHSADSLPAAPSTATSDSADAAQLDSSTEQGTAARFPLLVDSWRAVAADLSKVSLSSCLGASGFNPSIPTVWLAEALLYYLTLDQACVLLADMRALSAPYSKLVATCIDRELHIADHERMDKRHYFHAMWHFSIDDLLCDGHRSLQKSGWTVDMQPRTTAELAQERYARPTYVPVYGGAECVFTARVCS
jgi:O-methyltransferase involved in polyketide biosynthesis